MRDRAQTAAPARAILAAQPQESPMSAIFRSAVAAAGIVIATPVLAWTVYPDVDFEWYLNASQRASYAEEAMPAPRAGLIWSPGHSETRGTRQAWVAGHWIQDDYADQLALYNAAPVDTASK
jgi:hypothetical protein